VIVTTYPEHHLDKLDTVERRCALMNLEYASESWGHGEGPYYCDDSRIPGLWYVWERTNDGGYVAVGPGRYPGQYNWDTVPWLHCSSCGDRLKKVGVNARCGRQLLRGTQARDENPPPCKLCCELGRICCSACCTEERAAPLREKAALLRAELKETTERLAGSNGLDADESCYFIEGVGTGLIKIGFTGSVKRRLQTLRTMSPTELRVLAVFRGGCVLEKRLHQELAAARVHGEWFRDCPELRAALERLSAPDSPVLKSFPLSTMNARVRAIHGELKELEYAIERIERGWPELSENEGEAA
jgi:hypothetical protein